MCGVMRINQTYWDDPFTTYTIIKTLACIPNTNKMLHVSYTSI